RRRHTSFSRDWSSLPISDSIRRGPPFWKVWYCSGDNGYSSTVRPIPWSPWYGQTSELSPVEVHLVHIFPYRMGQHRPDVLSLSMGLSDESGGDFHNRGGHPIDFRMAPELRGQFPLGYPGVDL